MTTLLKKISVKNIIGNIKKIVTEQTPDDKGGVKPKYEDGTLMPLVNVYGRAKGFKTGESDFGTWVAFTGTFEAVDLRTGEVSQAPQVFVVEPLQSMIMQQLAENDAVDFACELSVVVNSNLPQGYEYRVKPLTEVKQSDELDSLRLLAGKPSLVALAAPLETVVENEDASPAKATPKKK